MSEDLDEIESKLLSKEKCRNSLITWLVTRKLINKSSVSKDKIFLDMYKQLERKLNLKGKTFFDCLILQSYYVAWMKMKKNKAKYVCMTVFWIVLEAMGVVLSSVAYFKVLFGSSDNITEIVKRLTDIISENFGVIAIIKSFLLSIGGFVLAVLVIIAIIFCIHKFLELSLKEFKPKETWVRHSRQFYSLSMEIMKYLDSSKEYSSNGIRPLTEDEAYIMFQTRIIKIWEENQETFILNMNKDNKNI